MDRLTLMLSRATNPTNESVDILALDTFTTIIRADEITYAQPATKLIVQKVHSCNTKEALLALDFLESCMDCCGTRFVQEVGKFKFLNELIKLVSRKHLGDKTPREIQTKILDILFTWTTEFPDEHKIKEAYDMLKAQGIVHEPTKNVMVSGQGGSHSAVVTRNFTSNKTELDPRQTMLRKLINSKSKDDIAKANLLIQNMCREDERRMQIKERRIMEYKKACESITVLNEVLDNYDAKEATNEDIAMINEIHETCDLFQPTLVKLINEMDKDDELTAKVLEVNDNLTAVLSKYRRKVVLGEDEPATEQLLDDILELEPSNNRATEPVTTNVLDELEEIFNTNLPTPIPSTTTTTAASAATSLLEPQKPKAPSSKYEVLMSVNKDKPAPPRPPVVKETPAPRALDLDSLILGMKSKLLPQNNGTKDEPKIEEKDDAILDSDGKNEEIESIIQLPAAKSTKNSLIPQPAPKSLLEIDLKLDELRPSSMPPRIVLDEPQGLKISLNFVRDRPRDDVLVVVISTINQGPAAVKNFQLDASIPKPCKVRLLSPSGTDIPGVKLFQPPSGIFQMLLVANATEKPVKITCILSYYLDNDPDPVKESIEVPDLPYKCD